MNYQETHEFPVITLCGSTRFESLFHIVLTVNCWSKKDVLHDPQTEETTKVKAMLDRIHKEKIRLSDSILVINKDGYVGKSTQSEIDFAVKLGKPVRYLYSQPSVHANGGSK